jgi:hypothetical protein
VISYLSELGALGITNNRRGMFPFTITHEGRLGGSYTLYADTEETRSMWRSKLEEAIQLRQRSSRVFKMKMLNRESFLMKTGVSNGYLPEGLQFTRTINCVTPFSTSHIAAILSILTKPRRQQHEMVDTSWLLDVWRACGSAICVILSVSFPPTLGWLEFDVVLHSFPPYTSSPDDTTIQGIRRVRNCPNTRP